MKNALQIDPLAPHPADYRLTNPERRQEERQITMLRLAKVKTASGEGWGFIKNLSARGMMVEVNSNFDLGDSFSAFLTEEQKLTGKVKWRDGSLAGIVFEEPVDVAKILSKTNAVTKGRIPRLPRVEMKHPINLYQGSKLIHANISDISPAGICVTADFSFEIGKKLRLSVPELLDINGTVRWQLGDRVGIVFSERLPLDDLMIWLSTFYRATKIDSDELAAASKENKIASVFDPRAYSLPFQVLGHDDAGKEFLIDRIYSASETLIQFKATSKFFDEVSIRDAGDVAVSIGTIVMRAFEEEQAAAKSQLN